MNLFLLNIFLALLWCALAGSFQLADLVVGLIFGAAVVGVGQRALGQRPGYIRALVTLLRFLWFAVCEIVMANASLAKVLLRPKLRLDPAVVTVPLMPQGPGTLTILANLITLTPGTITLDIAPDGREVYIHNLVLGDETAFVAQIKSYEGRVLDLFYKVGEQS